MIKKLLCILVIVLISGCGMQEGTLMIKEHQPEISWTELLNARVRMGRTNAYQHVLHTVTDDEDWIFIISFNNRECKIYVTKKMYSLYNTGDYVYISDLDGSFYDKHKKERLK